MTRMVRGLYKVSKNLIITNKKDAKALLAKVHKQIEITKNVLKEKNKAWMQTLLDWGHQHITQDSNIFPETCDNMLTTTKISLRWNRLTYIPKELWNMKQLQTLELNNNNLSNLSTGIANLENLCELNLNLNNLQKLPKEIIQLRRLKYLNIKNNKSLELSSRQVSWLKNLIANGCIVKYDKYKFNLGE